MPIQTAVIDYGGSTVKSFRKIEVLVYHIAPLESWGTTEERAVEFKYCKRPFSPVCPWNLLFWHCQL